MFTAGNLLCVQNLNADVIFDREELKVSAGVPTVFTTYISDSSEG